MSEHRKGGPLPPGAAKCRIVDYPSVERREGEGLVLYSDECVISRDSVCLRLDDLHHAAPVMPGPRWWACPLQDNR